jgi:hypothetical protein
LSARLMDVIFSFSFGFLPRIPYHTPDSATRSALLSSSSFRLLQPPLCLSNMMCW